MTSSISSVVDLRYYNSTATNFTTTCFKNVTLTPKQKVFLAQRISNIFKVYHGWLAMPVAVLGMLFTIIYILSVVRAIKLHRVSRKCYVLLLNRAIGDIFGCFIGCIIVSYVLLVETINRDLMQLLDVFFVGTFWAGMVSYVLLSVLKLYAIARPLEYRNNVTMIKCIYLISFSWLVFLLLTSYALLVTAFVKIPFLNDWTGCRIETCMRAMYRRRNVAVVTVYLFTIICFLLTLILVHKATQLGKLFHHKSTTQNSNETSMSHRGDSVARKISNRFPLWKLALNVVTFALFNAPYVIWAIWLLLKATDKCYFQHNYPSMMRYLGFIRASLLLRIVLDPILCLITDFQVRRSMFTVFGVSKIIAPFLSPQETQSEENSSECATYNKKIKFGSQVTVTTNVNSST